MEWTKALSTVRRPIAQTWALVRGYATLAARVEALERRLGKWPGTRCLRCGALAFRVEKTEEVRVNSFGGMRNQHTWRCAECGFTERWWATHPLEREQPK